MPGPIATGKMPMPRGVPPAPPHGLSFHHSARLTPSSAVDPNADATNMETRTCEIQRNATRARNDRVAYVAGPRYPDPVRSEETRTDPVGRRSPLAILIPLVARHERLPCFPTVHPPSPLSGIKLLPEWMHARRPLSFWDWGILVFARVSGRRSERMRQSLWDEPLVPRVGPPRSGNRTRGRRRSPRRARRSSPANR